MTRMRHGRCRSSDWIALRCQARSPRSGLSGGNLKPLSAAKRSKSRAISASMSSGMSTSRSRRSVWMVGGRGITSIIIIAVPNRQPKISLQPAPAPIKARGVKMEVRVSPVKRRSGKAEDEGSALGKRFSSSCGTRCVASNTARGLSPESSLTFCLRWLCALALPLILQRDQAFGIRFVFHEGKLALREAAREKRNSFTKQHRSNADVNLIHQVISQKLTRHLASAHQPNVCPTLLANLRHEGRWRLVHKNHAAALTRFLGPRHQVHPHRRLGQLAAGHAQSG